MIESRNRYLKLFGVNEPSKIFNDDELVYISSILSREEETSNLNRDQWGNFDVQMTKNEFHKPYLDLFVRNKLKSLNIPQSSIWPHNADFAVCLSHDVDRTESYSPTSFLRNLRKKYRFGSFEDKLKLFPKIIKTFAKKMLLTKRNDVLWQYEKWQEIERKFNAKSTYFFFVRPNDNNISIFDCDYRLTDKMKFEGKFVLVSDYIQNLSKNGFEIGLHGSFNTYDNSKLLELQKRELEEIIGTPIVSTRQHYLHFDVTKTPKTHVDIGIKSDSTLGFNNDIGFRAGTAFPFYFEANKKFLLEIPLLIMDSALYNNAQFGYEKAIEKVLTVIDYVEQVQGCLTINFHPDYFHLDKYFKTYEYILQVLSERNCIFMTVNEIHQIIENKCVE